MDLKKAWEDFKELLRMHRELCDEHPEPDVRRVLRAELARAVLFNDPALQRRHLNELAFRQDMDRRWR